MGNSNKKERNNPSPHPASQQTVMETDLVPKEDDNFKTSRLRVEDQIEFESNATKKMEKYLSVSITSELPSELMSSLLTLLSKTYNMYEHWTNVIAFINDFPQVLGDNLFHIDHRFIILKESVYSLFGIRSSFALLVRFTVIDYKNEGNARVYNVDRAQSCKICGNFIIYQMRAESKWMALNYVTGEFTSLSNYFDPISLRDQTRSIKKADHCVWQDHLIVFIDRKGLIVCDTQKKTTNEYSKGMEHVPMSARWNLSVFSNSDFVIWSFETHDEHNNESLIFSFDILNRTIQKIPNESGDPLAGGLLTSKYLILMRHGNLVFLDPSTLKTMKLMRFGDKRDIDYVSHYPNRATFYEMIIVIDQLGGARIISLRDGFPILAESQLDDPITPFHGGFLVKSQYFLPLYPIKRIKSDRFQKMINIYPDSHFSFV